MRVIAGRAGGIPLCAPGPGTRPTMDKVRAAVFSSLGDCIAGARVLDLFAGSGAFGIESMSRGAKAATFVDASPRAARCIRRNLERTGMTGDVRAIDAFRYIDLHAPPAGFDLVFADPPYRKEAGDEDFAIRLLASGNFRRMLDRFGTFVLESSILAKLRMEGFGDWNVLRTKRYGETAVHFLTPRDEPSATGI